MERNIEKTSLYKQMRARKEENSLFCYPRRTKYRPIQRLEIDSNHFASMPNLDNWLKEFEKHDLVRDVTLEEPKTEFTKDEALEIVYSYFTSTSSKIANSFRSIFDKRDTNLVLTRTNKKVDSGTTYLERTGDVLMQVSFDGSISSLTSLVHEYAHAIGFKNKPVEMRTGAENSFIEIESYLHSILFLDYLDKEGYQDDTNFERNEILNTAIDSTDIIRKKKFLVTRYNELLDYDPEITYKEFLKYLKQEFGLTKRDYKSVMSTPADIVSPYVIGPYIAFELYNLYQKDPEYALFLFAAYTHVYASTPADYFNQVENGGIIPGKNIEPFTRKLKRTTK